MKGLLLIACSIIISVAGLAQSQDKPAAPKHRIGLVNEFTLITLVPFSYAQTSAPAVEKPQLYSVFVAHVKPDMLLEFESFVKDRYSSFDSGIGSEIESGNTDFKKLEAYMLAKGEIAPNKSGRQEMLEHLLNRYI